MSECATLAIRPQLKTLGIYSMVSSKGFYRSSISNKISSDVFILSKTYKGINHTIPIKKKDLFENCQYKIKILETVYSTIYVKKYSKLWYNVLLQHPTKHQLYGHLPPITKTIQVRRTRHAGYCWRSRDELISDVLLWTPSYGRTKAGRPARTYIQQLCEYTGCSPEDLPEAMNDREEWRERVRDICAGGTT